MDGDAQSQVRSESVLSQPEASVLSENDPQSVWVTIFVMLTIYFYLAADYIIWQQTILLGSRLYIF